MSRPAETIPDSVDPDALLVRPARDRTQKLGRRLVSHFYLVAKTAAMFDFSNVNAREALSTFLATLDELLSVEPEVTLQVASDCVFVNESRLKIDFEGFASFKYAIEAFNDRDIGAVTFARGVSEEDLTVFLRLWIENDRSVAEPRHRIRRGLEAAGIDRIELEESRALPETVTRKTEGERETSLNTYFKAIFVAKQFMEDFHGRRTRYLQKARRLVHSIVDIIAQDESTLLALTQIKNFDEFLFTHSANVCVLSVSLGQNLGLDKVLLGALGLAALTHDVGMMEIPKGLFERRDSLLPEERLAYERHPAAGVQAILKSQGVSDVSIRCALVAFEHHLNEDYSGFPSRVYQRPRSLLSRIVAICDFYDTITTPGSEDDRVFSPEEALRLMAHEGSDVFNPLLVKVFINTIGTYPLGTLVRLDTGEIGIIHRRAVEGSAAARPLVKLIADELGMPIPHEVVDLNEWDAERDRYRRSIAETISPSDYFDEAQEFIDLL